MKEYIFAVNEKTPDAIGLSVGQIRRNSKELIRCKDCTHYPHRTVSFAENVETDTVYMHCFLMGADGYCSKSERLKKNDRR